MWDSRLYPLGVENPQDIELSGVKVGVVSYRLFTARHTIPYKLPRYTALCP